MRASELQLPPTELACKDSLAAEPRVRELKEARRFPGDCRRCRACCPKLHRCRPFARTRSVVNRGAHGRHSEVLDRGKLAQPPSRVRKPGAGTKSTGPWTLGKYPHTSDLGTPPAFGVGEKEQQVNEEHPQLWGCKPKLGWRFPQLAGHRGATVVGQSWLWSEMREALRPCDPS